MVAPAPPPRALPGPAAAAIVTVMETIGEDLLLLAVRPNGKLGAAAKLRFGLSGSELVRLAAARKNLKQAAKRERPASPAVGAVADAAAHHHGGAVGGHH
jgi:hypothetical protein